MIEYKLKPLVENSWILHNNGVRIAIITKNDYGYSAIGKIEKKQYNSIDELAKFLHVKISIEEPEVESTSVEVSDVLGYPIKHSTAFDIKEGEYPSYSKIEGSQNRFAAGYYGLCFPNGWTPAYCPKTATLDGIEWIGPFRSKLEMNNSISQAKRRSN